jgi:hypothetical protein
VGSSLPVLAATTPWPQLYETTIGVMNERARNIWFRQLRAFDEKVESLIVDSHEGANRIQDPHWCKGGQS